MHRLRRRLPLGMGTLPAGECVGGKAAVNEGQVGLIVLVLQVWVVLPQLGCSQQTLQQVSTIFNNAGFPSSQKPFHIKWSFRIDGLH